MAFDYNKLNEELNLDDIFNDAKAGFDGDGQGYREVPPGDYEVEIIKLEVNHSKAGNIKLETRFRIIAGQYENSQLFYHQSLTTQTGAHFANVFLKSLNVPFTNEKGTYAELVNKIFDFVSDGREYALRYGKKGEFGTFEILRELTE